MKNEKAQIVIIAVLVILVLVCIIYSGVKYNRQQQLIKDFTNGIVNDLLNEK